jgi:hypothetical protein
MIKYLILIFAAIAFTSMKIWKPGRFENANTKIIYRGFLYSDDLVSIPKIVDNSELEIERQPREVVFDPDGKFIIYSDGSVEQYNVSSGLNNAVSALIQNGHHIEDVYLTGYNQWAVIFDKNRYLCSNIPHEMKLELDEYRRNGQGIHTIALTDNNDWLILGDSTFSTSAEHVKHYIDYGQQKFGPIETAHFDDRSLVIILQNGNVTYGQVPDKVKRAITTGNKTIHRLRYRQNGSYFIRYADESSDLAILY